MIRGQYDKPGEKVEPGHARRCCRRCQKPDARANRLDLARWLVAPENPLTARVTVNRFWQQVFGTGLVKTATTSARRATCPAIRSCWTGWRSGFQESGWDVKSLMRLMLTSATFRQQCGPGRSLAERSR